MVVSALWAVAMAAFVSMVVAMAAAELQVHFYKDSCPQAELVVKGIMQQRFSSDPSLPAGLLRLHFHDCFVHGCDGSVLIDSSGNNVAEKDAPPNLTLRGFEVIDEIKAELEKQCKGIVSCADILALATRDGVALTGGSAYALPTGRRDGTVSNISDVHIPGPSFSVAEAASAFQTINLSLEDLVTLLGAHAMGFCHCGFFVDRLYNFGGSGQADPDIDPQFLGVLRQKCPRPNNNVPFNLSTDPKIFMTPSSGTPFKLDASFYRGVLQEQATLQLDQGLAFTDLTRRIAADYIGRPNVFRRKFAKAMIKLGNVDVLTGQQGEIRANCRRFNQPNHDLNHFS
ncbi:peroxidase 57-like [Rhodamnia argentea]|uniref:Peroxidase n=1 Tax=Rhodamnia argentea TaxID=178133 RepID=A0A8B8PFG8_9MYRT|nr:peroxidase 57-like [Rhodamnia argentea]